MCTCTCTCIRLGIGTDMFICMFREDVEVEVAGRCRCGCVRVLIYLSIYVSIYPSIHLSIHLSIYLSMSFLSFYGTTLLSPRRLRAPHKGLTSCVPSYAASWWSLYLKACHHWNCIETIGSRGSKYPTFKDSGSLRVWLLEPESLNVGYLDPLGWIQYSRNWALRSL